MTSTERVILKEFEVLNCSTQPDFFGGPEVVGGRGEKIVRSFKKSLKINIVKKEGFDLEFDLIGVDPSIANAIRRILLSDVPSMAFDRVHIYNNTSIIQDEVLAHRLGLIPIKADPRLFKYKPKRDPNVTDFDQQVQEDMGTIEDTLEFELKVRCKRNPNAPEGAKYPNELYQDNNAYTKHIKWIPKPGQEKMLKGKHLGPVEDDILIAKLRPGHELDIKLYAYKGVGRDHAKFSPVCTAYYRLLPEIIIKNPVYGEDAELLQKCFSPGVIGLEDCTIKDPVTRKRLNTKKAVVLNSRYDASSRNVFRHSKLKDEVVLQKVKDHYIFTVESCGAVQPEELVIEAIQVLADKCDFYIQELQNVG